MMASKGLQEELQASLKARTRDSRRSEAKRATSPSRRALRSNRRSQSLNRRTRRLNTLKKKRPSRLQMLRRLRRKSVGRRPKTMPKRTSNRKGKRE
jgi:hypothetical protein